MTINGSTESGWMPDPAGAEEEIRPHFPNVEAFVTQYLASHVQRVLGGHMTWCAQWWRHNEALSRLNSLWMAWEHWRLQGADGMSTWWIHHHDPHMNVLLSRDAGPFARCTPTQHRDGEPLACTPVSPEILQLSAFSDQAAGS
ncbi:DUF4913 domain-containing protein [Nonomuraea sp. NPDC003707]